MSDVRDTMTGPEHYAAALRYLAYNPDIVMSRADASALAQAHAALAIAATFGTEIAHGPSSREMRETRWAWAAVLANTRAGS